MIASAAAPSDVRVNPRLDSEAPKRTGTPVRVLLVEDNSELRSCIKEVLEMWGFHVDTVGDGLAAVEAGFRRRYKVVITDMRLPGMKGTGVIRSLTAMNPATKFIVITAFPDWSVGLEAREAGAAHVLHKPLDLEDLARLVELTAAGPSAA